MKIEIAEPGRMAQTGSSLFRLMQNNDMPLIDLFVRESLQNSLDARKNDAKCVDVDYVTGKFNSTQLSQEFEGVTEALREKYPNKKYDYLAIRDSNTIGLTGEMDYTKVKDNNYGNLLKLVYEICKPQDSEGAGGSWGIGKTVYFRMGIGLVIYYSRIKMKDGTYESRLAASYVEDEKLEDALIPVYKDFPKRGIAWWGDLVGENKTQPITDKKYIKEFLDIFKVSEYTQDETGTMVIIPYIDSEKLILSNQKEHKNLEGEEIVLPWETSLEEYLKISTQRWYAPRLSNKNYKQGAVLRLRINGIGLAKTTMEPVFRIVQSLYNQANSVDDEDDFLKENKIEVKCESIKITKYLQNKEAGTVAFAKVSKKDLKMEPPHNKLGPYMFLNCIDESSEYNVPIVCYTRKPGMIVAYENSGSWVSKIGNTDKNEYIFAVFVLNSNNEMKDSPIECSLEEYIRNTEKADHTSWVESSDGKYKPRIVAKIKDKLNKAINKAYIEDSQENESKKNAGLGKLLGDMLLPPIGFGKSAGSVTPKPNVKINLRKKGYVFKIDNQKIRYNSKNMEIPINLEISSKQISNVAFEMKIDSESNQIAINDWEDKMALEPPFEIKTCTLVAEKNNDPNDILLVELSADKKEIEIEDIKMVRKLTKNGTGCGIEIKFNKPIIMKGFINIKVEINRNDVKPSFSFEKEKNHD